MLVILLFLLHVLNLNNYKNSIHFPPLDPVHSHQRYHSDYSSSSESPSVTSSDPDYRQGRDMGEERETTLHAYKNEICCGIKNCEALFYVTHMRR